MNKVPRVNAYEEFIDEVIELVRDSVSKSQVQEGLNHLRDKLNPLLIKRPGITREEYLTLKSKLNLSFTHYVSNFHYSARTDDGNMAPVIQLATITYLVLTSAKGNNKVSISDLMKSISPLCFILLVHKRFPNPFENESPVRFFNLDKNINTAAFLSKMATLRLKFQKDKAPIGYQFDPEMNPEFYAMMDLFSD